MEIEENGNCNIEKIEEYNQSCSLQCIKLEEK